MSTLFISYSMKDRSVAAEVYDRLTEWGYHLPFLDYHPDAGIPGGADWEEELRWQLKVAHGLIVLCSEDWALSKWCFWEYRKAFEAKKVIIPLKLDGVNLADHSIDRTQAIDFEGRFVRRTADWDEVLPDARPLLDKMASAQFRLVTIDWSSEAATTVEVNHESLFRAWETLERWLGDRVDLLSWRADVQRSRHAAGEHWSGLTPGQRARAAKWPSERSAELTDDEKAWIRRAKNGVQIQWGVLVASTLHVDSQVWPKGTTAGRILLTTFRTSSFAKRDCNLHAGSSC